MILVHSAPTTLARYRTLNLGVLSSPRRFYTDVEGWSWAADNDAFASWDEALYEKMLEGITGLKGCLFVTAPDVIGDAEETLRRFWLWLPRLRETGLPIALVGQDGLKPASVPWDEIRALFLGGSTLWKMGFEAAVLAREAKRRGKWLHMGRVNSHRRIIYAKALGCDSIDGNRVNWFKDSYLLAFLQSAASPTQEMIV